MKEYTVRAWKEALFIHAELGLIKVEHGCEYTIAHGRLKDLGEEKKAWRFTHLDWFQTSNAAVQRDGVCENTSKKQPENLRNGQNGEWNMNWRVFPCFLAP